MTDHIKVDIEELAEVLSGHMIAASVAYSSEDRHYHNVHHLVKCLEYGTKLIDDMRLGANEAIALALSIFYHDTVYDPTSPKGKNEHLSAMLATECLVMDTELGELGEASGRYTLTVYAAILATIDHTVESVEYLLGGNEASTDVVKAMIDCDLAGLASEEYWINRDNVRKEYAHLSEEEWTTGRIAFLESLLNRKNIFVTEYGSKHWETLARVNISQELLELRGN